ncbi:putative cation-transporting ATPase E [Ligilactobacillus salivarius]|nr:putative cation-transporting ATPase E [Ligilactobacillus salivarius]
MKKSSNEKIDINRITPNADYGLTDKQVEKYKKNGWSNEAVKPPVRTAKEIVAENIFTYFNLIFLILTLLLCLVNSFRNLTFLPIIIANIFIGIIQELRAKKVVDKLTMLNVPQAMVVRNGEVTQVNAEDLVLDDIVIFKTGNQILADSEIVSGEVLVNESLLTGESDEIPKKPGDKLMSGSFIIAGKCRARLTAVGKDSYISKLTLEAKKMKNVERSEMIQDLDILVKFVGIALVPIGIVLFIQGIFINHESLHDNITSMVAAVLGMIPEGLYLLTSVALAVSSMRLAKKKVLLHDMKSIETLVRVDVLCVDKTGTITENEMKVEKIKAIDVENRDAFEELLAKFVYAIDESNNTMKAIRNYCKQTSKVIASEIIPFTSKNKYSGAVFENDAYILGAPEFVLREDFPLYQDNINEDTKKGYRVLVFGKALDGFMDKKITGKVIPIGYVLITNPIRKEVTATFNYFKEQGVEVKVISGDNPQTVSEISKKAQIENADLYIDATKLETKEDLAEAVKNYNIFGRVTPTQKREIIRILKEQGRTVAMTGDGVNDVLALKDADCSIDMASGSDAAVYSSQVVLLESNFSCMPDVVLEGRRVVNNIQRSASLFLVKNIFSFFLSMLAVILSFTYPLKPAQVSLIGIFTIGIPAFFLALQPNKEKIEGRFFLIYY